MPLDLYLGFAAASALLILAPGPVVSLIVANSLGQGPRAGFVTVAGSSSAALLHMAFVCAGLASLLAVLGAAFFWIKWVGGAYLLYLGVRALFAAPPDLRGAPTTEKSVKRTYVEAFAVGYTNPKALMFFAAFFPLFIAPDRPVAPQLFLMSATYLVIGACLDSLWALAAARARPLLLKAGRWGNRITGGVLILAAAALVHARRA